MSSWQKQASKIYKQNPELTWPEAIQLYKQSKAKLTKKLGGEGIFEVKKGFNTKSSKTIKEYGSLPIVKIELRRAPIFDIAKNYVKLASLGRANLDYDKLYHLSLVATVSENGVLKKVLLEKNEVVSVEILSKSDEKDEYFNVPLHKKKLSVFSLLNDALQNVGPDIFFKYDPYENNCINFIKVLLESSGLYNANCAKFLLQNIDDLINKTPAFAQAFAKGVTHVAALFDKWFGGRVAHPIGGFKKPREPKRKLSRHVKFN